MRRPIVHVEITGKDPQSVREYFTELFEWSFDVPSRVAEGISEPDTYGFLNHDASDE